MDDIYWQRKSKIWENGETYNGPTGWQARRQEKQLEKKQRERKKNRETDKRINKQRKREKVR